MAEWETVLDLVDDWKAAWEPSARSLQKIAGETGQPTNSMWVQPEQGIVLVLTNDDLGRSALEKLASETTGLPLGNPNTAICRNRSPWVKLSDTIRPVRVAGELLNILPSTTGIPNAPSPLAAMLTTALLGGGVGYAGGLAAEKLSPVKLQGKRLRKLTAVIGAAAGAGLVAPWAIDNLSQQGLPGLLSPSPFDDVGPAKMQAIAQMKSAAAMFPSFGRDPTSVDVNALGETVWASGASPQLTAATMGTVYAALQFPDPSAAPNTVTAHQFGQLAVQAGGDYITGRLGGAILNRLTGFPITGHQAGLGLAVVNVLSTIIPKILGTR